MVDKISVVIPTHERPTLLRGTLESVLAQTRPADEIIVVDDADDQPTRNVVEAMCRVSADHGRRLRYLVNDGRAGASASRNLGVANTSGDVIALLDDDDSWLPTYLQCVVDRFEDSRADIVVTWRADVRGRWSLPYPSPREGLTARDVVAVNPGAGGSNICVRRETFDLIHGFDETLPMSDDKDFFLRLLQSGATYAVVKERLVLVGCPTGQRLTQVDTHHVASLKAYYEKHFDSCLRHHHRELRRKIRRAEWRVQRDHHARGWKRHLYTLGLLALARPRTLPTLPRLRELLIPPRPEAGESR